MIKNTGLALSENLKNLMRQAGLNPSTLAKLLGVKQPIVHRLVTGSNENPTLSTLKIFADFFKVSIGQLIGEGAFSPKTQSMQPHWQTVTLNSSMAVNAVGDKPLEIIPVDCALSLKAFALRVNDTCFSPAIPNGAIVVVEPSLKPAHGDFVVIKENHQWVIKIYLERDTKPWLVSSFFSWSDMELVSAQRPIEGTVVRVIYGRSVPQL